MGYRRRNVVLYTAAKNISNVCEGQSMLSTLKIRCMLHMAAVITGSTSYTEYSCYHV